MKSGQFWTCIATNKLQNPVKDILTLQKTLEDLGYPGGQSVVSV